jgi:hypothetical protein
MNLAILSFCCEQYREVRKFLAGAFFVSSGMCWYLWVTGVSLPIELPYVGTVSVETPEISGQRAIVHFVLFLLCFYSVSSASRRSRNETRQFVSHYPIASVAARP